MRYVIATIKPWNVKQFRKRFGRDARFTLISERSKLTVERLRKLKPQYVFFPHWSWIIPEAVWKEFTCVVFHMTDLPYGRGGTPLQNLILRGHNRTRISAIRVDAGLDTGDIYLKRPLSLTGSAQEIYERFADTVIGEMIPEIVKREPRPKPQRGKPVAFQRRKPEESALPNTGTLRSLYDHIRMLDADTYPKAFLDHGAFRVDFTEAKLTQGRLTARIELYEKDRPRRGRPS